MSLASELPSIESQFDEFATRVQAEIDQLDAEEQTVLAQIARIRESKARYQKVMRALHPEPPKPTKKRHGRPQGIAGRKISVGRVEGVAEAIQSLGMEEFCVGDVGEFLSLDSGNRTHIYEAFNFLRDIEYLAKVGHLQKPGKPASYRVLDSEALTRFKETMNG